MTLRRFTADCVPFWAIVGLISRTLSGLNRAWTSRRPRRQCAGVLADGFCFIYHWLCTEKPPTRGHTCRQHLLYIPLTMHKEAANAQTHLQTVPQPPQCHMPFQQLDHRARQCTAQRPVCSAGTGMPLSPTTRAHGKCAYAMCRRMLNRPQLTPAGMSAQPQRKHNAHKVRPARVRRLRHPKREEAARCCQRAAPALSVMRACASVASLIRLLDRGLMGAVQPVAGMRAAVQEVYAMMA